MKKSTQVVITGSVFSPTLYFVDDRTLAWVDLSDCCSETLFRAFHVVRQLSILEGGKATVWFGDEFYRAQNPYSMAIWLLLIRARYLDSITAEYGFSLRSNPGRPKATSISCISRANPFEVLVEGSATFLVDLIHRIDIGDCFHKEGVV